MPKQRKFTRSQYTNELARFPGAERLGEGKSAWMFVVSTAAGTYSLFLDLPPEFPECAPTFRIDSRLSHPRADVSGVLSVDAISEWKPSSEISELIQVVVDEMVATPPQLKAGVMAMTPPPQTQSSLATSPLSLDGGDDADKMAQQMQVEIELQTQSQTEAEIQTQTLCPDSPAHGIVIVAMSPSASTGAGAMLGVDFTEQMQLDLDRVRSMSAEPMVSGFADVKIRNTVHQIYADVLRARGVDPWARNKKYVDPNLVVALQKDWIKGRVAFTGRLLKDVNYHYVKNTHPLASVFLFERYHPLGQANRLILLFLLLFLNFSFYFGATEDRNPNMGQSILFSLVLWVVMWIYTWLLTAKWLVGASRTKACFVGCLKCICVNPLTKWLFVFWALCAWVGLLYVRRAVIYKYFLSLLLNFLVTGPLCSITYFYYYWKYGEMKQLPHNAQKRANALLAANNSDKQHKKFIVTANDSLIWRQIRDGQKLDLPAPSPAFEKFARKYGSQTIR